MRIPLPYVQIEFPTFAVVRIELFTPTGAKIPGQATGFFIRWKDVRYFVTNRHVVTLQDFFTGAQLIPNFAGLPTKLEGTSGVQLVENLRHASPDSDQYLEAGSFDGDTFKIELTVGGDDSVLDARWLLSVTADLAVYRLEEADGVRVTENGLSISYGCLEGRHLNHRITPRAMSECFIVGFPELGPQFRQMRSPVFKSASLAVEPFLWGSQPYLVDGKTKPGMSGSPVIFKCSDCSVWHLLGVYGGRECNDPELTQAELGMVWRFREHLLPMIEEVAGATSPQEVVQLV